MKKVTDPKLQDTNYTYFADGQLQQTSYTNAVIPTSSVSFTYDAAYGRVATMVDGTGTTTYGYHAVSAPPAPGATNMASMDGPLTNDTISYEYDQLGRVTTRAINGSANAVTWAFDVLGRTTSEANVLGTFTYAYDGPTGRVATVIYPNSQTTAYGYAGNSGDRRLQTIHHKYSNASTLSKFDYTYDVGGNIATWRQQADTPAVLWSYGYDKADQLASAVKASTDPTPVVLKRYTYAYDSAGNRTAEQIDDALMGATHDNTNRLVSQQASGALRLEGSVTEPATVTVSGKPFDVSGANRFTGSIPIVSGTTPFTVTARDASGNTASAAFEVDSASTGKTFTFDANGNLTGDGTRIFYWDAENRLLSVTAGTHATEFSYDGLSRRVRIVEKDNGSTTSDKRFLWCGLTICEERDSTGTTATKRFFAQGLHETVGGGASFFYARDHLGSVRELVDSSNTLRARYDYDPWGQRTNVAGDKDADFGYTGHYEHSASGLTLAPFRAYDASTGKWISEDPIGVEGGINLTAYANQNPILFVDPDGAIPVVANLVAGAAGAVIGGGIAYFSGGSVAQGVIAGGVAGLTLGLAGASIAGALGGGWVGGAAAGAVSQAVGNIASQTYAKATTNECFSWGGVTAATLGGAVGGGIILRPSLTALQPVTSWARAGVTPTLGPGRWVMTGGPSLRNLLFTGRLYPPGNSVSGLVPSSGLAVPPGLQAIKSLIGQFIIK